MPTSERSRAERLDIAQSERGRARGTIESVMEGRTVASQPGCWIHAAPRERVRAGGKLPGARRDRVRVGTPAREPPRGRFRIHAGPTTHLPPQPARSRYSRERTRVVKSDPKRSRRSIPSQDPRGRRGGSAAHSPRHAFRGDLSELSASGSDSDSAKRTTPSGELVPSIDFGAPSPGLPLVHPGGGGRQRASRPSHRSYCPRASVTILRDSGSALLRART